VRIITRPDSRSEEADLVLPDLSRRAAVAGFGTSVRIPRCGAEREEGATKSTHVDPDGLCVIAERGADMGRCALVGGCTWTGLAGELETGSAVLW
jgi:hypothetical protein